MHPASSFIPGMSPTSCIPSRTSRRRRHQNTLRMVPLPAPLCVLHRRAHPAVYLLLSQERGWRFATSNHLWGRQALHRISIDQSMKRAFVDVKAPFPLLLRIQVDVGRYSLCQFQYLTEVFLVSGRHMISLFIK